MGIVLHLNQISDEDLFIMKSHNYNNTDNRLENIDIDKAWHGIHFLLTGTNEVTKSAASSLLNGEKIYKNDDFLILTSSQVLEFNSHIENITPDILSRNYDPEKMDKLNVYPSNYSSGERLEYLLSYYLILKDFVNRTAKTNLALLLVFA